MTRPRIPAPGPGEHDPYFARYVDPVAGTDIRALLERQLPALEAACAGLTDGGALHRYAPGKWSIKEVVVHLADTERIFAYRALRVARGDTTPLPGFDQDPYVAMSGADRRPLADLLAELRLVRAATLALLDGVEPDAWERRGTASGATVSLRALAHIMAGHVQHHALVLAERYGVPASAVAPPA